VNRARCRATRCGRGGVRSTPASVWPDGLGRHGGPRGGDTRKRGRPRGRARSLAIEHVIRRMLTARRELTIGDDRPGDDARSVKRVTRLARSHIRRGRCRDDTAFFGGSGRRHAAPHRTTNVVPARRSRRARHRGFPVALSMACRRRPSRGLGIVLPDLGRGARFERSGSDPRDPIVTSAVGPRCVRSASVGRLRGGRWRRFGALTLAVRRPPSSRGSDEPGADGGPKPRRRCRSERTGPHEGTDAGVVRLAAAVILCSGA
jgi:hypothetical protein